jgi:hypothetical protein
MLVLSMFYGVIVRMFDFDTDTHELPHVHVQYLQQEAAVAIESGDVLAGGLPPDKMKLVAAWMEIHREELLADWALAAKGETIFAIEPLH